MDNAADIPQRGAAANLAHEALEKLRALASLRDFRVELHAVEAPLLVRHCRKIDGIR